MNEVFVYGVVFAGLYIGVIGYAALIERDDDELHMGRRRKESENV